MPKKDMYDIENAKTINNIYLKVNERAEYPYLDEPIILDSKKYKNIDDIKKYLLFNKLKSKFLVKLYKNGELSENNYWHLREWYYWRKFFNISEEDNKKKIDLWELENKAKIIKI